MWQDMLDEVLHTMELGLLRQLRARPNQKDE